MSDFLDSFFYLAKRWQAIKTSCLLGDGFMGCSLRTGFSLSKADVISGYIFYAPMSDFNFLDSFFYLAKRWQAIKASRFLGDGFMGCSLRTVFSLSKADVISGYIFYASSSL